MVTQTSTHQAVLCRNHPADQLEKCSIYHTILFYILFHTTSLCWRGRGLCSVWEPYKNSQAS